MRAARILLNYLMHSTSRKFHAGRRSICLYSGVFMNHPFKRGAARRIVRSQTIKVWVQPPREAAASEYKH